jgi:AcrR family transcriptional regulator
MTRGSEATRQALVEAAERLFTEHGYAGTSLDAIVAGADVTKGALYHHFSGKQAIFEAAFEQVESRAAAAIAGASDGLAAFLDVVQQPGYRQIVVADGPAVLGPERFGEHEQRSTYAVVDDVVRSVLGTGGWDPEMLDTFARIFFGALSAAGGAVATSDDPAAAAARVEAAVGFILAGLRAQMDATC